MIISDVRVVDVVNGRIRGPAHVVVESNKIADIVEGPIPEVDPGHVWKAEGKYLAPGMINVHEHQTFKLIPGAFADTIADSPEALLLRSVRSGLVSLSLGVTTVRELGAKAGTNLVMRNALRDGAVPGPTMQAAGEPLCRTGGHAWQMCIEIDGPDGVRRAVRDLHKRGTDWVKIMASGGALPGQTFETACVPQFTDEEMSALLGEAHRLGLPTAAHALGPAPIRQVVEAGVTSVEHGVGLDEATVDLMLKHKTWLVPTLSVYHQSVYEHERWGRSGAALAASKSMGERHMMTMRLALQAGLPVAAGTDSVGDMVEEMCLLVRLGMEPTEAVRAATVNGARLMGIEDQVGTVEVGKCADLVVLGENPIVDPKAYQKPLLVMHKGQVVFDAQGGLRVAVCL